MYGMKPLAAIATGFRENIDWSGRSSVSQFWWFFLFLSAMSWLLVLATSGATVTSMPGGLATVAGIFLVFVGIAAVTPRLHDTGRSGGSDFFYLISIIGQLVLLVLLVTPSAPKQNRYGPGPRGSDKAPA